MKYIDKYPGCAGCPHHKYCGTMVSSIRLCNSYERDAALDESREYLTPEQGVREAQRIYPLKAYDPEEEETSDQD